MYRRAAEAATLRIAATVLRTPAAPPAVASVIVLGDCSDTPQAATTPMLYGPPGSQYDTPGFDHSEDVAGLAQYPDRGNTTRLWTIARKIPAEERYSRLFEGNAN
ncbi:hypothetical protein P3H15_28140 [Rhodococcus sp. T2V]|uniref:hypothetical protein n=1 Tax=Rhodococcus sp. T2V TaxID=3034164 RepID=UPI0023E0DB6D|nr:hypothetical protein [Rhodococcus sp. T2V]MDF3308889.1 hypothetical protein [Rhodococcus sp. T2V]